ncbi:MAG: hypothetical protein WHT07_00790 [Desulfobaccales bacterium]
MDRETRLAAVKTLTRMVLKELAPPEESIHFDGRFARFAQTAGLPQAEERLAFFRSREQGLDLTLVAGMFFQVLLEAESLPAHPQERVAYVRRQAKNYLITRLAGEVPLSRFFRLLELIDAHVRHYFDNLRGGWLRPDSAEAAESSPVAPPNRLRTRELREALARMPLQPTGRRKFTQESLLAFLESSQGGWFKLLDFETHFQVNKKTAWAYLNLLLQEGILEHNGEKANKVRYTLARRFREGEPPPEPTIRPRPLPLAF